LLAATLTRVLADLSPQVTVGVDAFETRIKDTLLRDRLMATLAAFFGGLAGLLATIGLYGVIAYMVLHRRNEIGIRIALGADRRAVIGLILREAAVLLAAGLSVGIALAVGLAELARTLVFGLEPADPATLGISVALLTAVMLAASYLPARRAARVDPAVALRIE
jgi:ABC-type antimicrobial peptide transport system permease subunit